MRALRLTRRFQVDQHHLAPRGSPEWRGVAQALRELMADPELPRRDDRAIEIPHAVVGRRVPDAGLVICFIPAVGEVHLVALVRG